jgi:hypothetical protein
MFKFKAKSPLMGLLMALVIMLGLYMMMERLMQTSQVQLEEPLPEVTTSFFSDDELAIFKDKWSEQNEEGLQLAHEKIAKALQEKKREHFYGTLAIHLEQDDLRRAPHRFIGQMVPVYFDDAGEFDENLSSEFLWRTMSWKGQKVKMMLMNPYVGDERKPTYAEMFFLGERSEGGETVWRGVALDLYELPESRHYPSLDSDQLAFGLIVDDMSTRKLQKMTRDVSAQAFSHFLAKVQKGDAEELTPMDVKYSQLMDSPDLYRGKMVEFTGTLIFKKRNRLTSQGLPPGMDVYEEGYLLNSNQVLYVFRAPKIPAHLELKDIITVKGYFLQRFNFLNRMGRAAWGPLLVASSIEKVKEQDYGMTLVEQRWIFLILAIMLLAFAWLAMRRPMNQKRLVIKKPLKPSSKNKH